MQKYLLIVSLTLLTSCTLPWSQEHYEHPVLSGEVPAAATDVEGYEYPAIPLDEFNKMQNTSTVESGN